MRPDVPTIAEAGVPGFALDVWMGLTMSAKVPAPVVAKVNADLARDSQCPRGEGEARRAGHRRGDGLAGGARPAHTRRRRALGQDRQDGGNESGVGSASVTASKPTGNISLLAACRT